MNPTISGEEALPPERGELPPSKQSSDPRAESAGKPAGARMLVVDDDPALRRVLSCALASAGFRAAWAVTGAEGLARAQQWHPDVVILDLWLPDMTGNEVCQKLRAWSDVPILVISALADEADKVSALEAGADDYLTKPFGTRELLARIDVALRHAAQKAGGAPSGVMTQTRFQTGELAIDFARRRVSVGGREVHLTPTEYALLTYLAQHSDRVVPHEVLLHAVWGPAYDTESHYLRVYVNQLRRKIEPDPSRPIYVRTEPGIGYRLQRR